MRNRISKLIGILILFILVIFPQNVVEAYVDDVYIGPGPSITWLRNNGWGNIPPGSSYSSTVVGKTNGTDKYVKIIVYLNGSQGNFTHYLFYETRVVWNNAPLTAVAPGAARQITGFSGASSTGYYRESLATKRMTYYLPITESDIGRTFTQFSNGNELSSKGTYYARYDTFDENDGTPTGSGKGDYAGHASVRLVGSYTVPASLWNTPPTTPASITTPTTLKSNVASFITWGSSTDADGDILSYSLERSVNGGTYSQVYSGSSKSYSDTPLTTWNSVAYRVRAYDSKSYSGYITSPTRIVINDITGPTIAFGTNGNATYAKSQSTTITAADPSGLGTLQYVWSTSTTTPTTGWATFTNGTTISQSNVTGNYYLHIKATDALGNLSTGMSNVFKLDNTLPSISFSPNGKSTPSTILSVAINTSDGDSGIKTLQYQRTTSSTFPTSGTWTTIAPGFAETKLNMASGNYYYHAKSTDAAGNLYQLTSPAFVIDTTPPVAPTVSHTPTGKTNGNVTLTAIFPSDAVVKQYKLSTASTWSNYTGTLTVTSNGTYEFRGMDALNNESITVTHNITNIDKIPPVITFDPLGNSTPLQTQSTKVTVIDTGGSTLSSSKYQWTNSITFPVVGTWLNFNTDETIVLNSVTGDYYLHIIATDVAGNITKQTSGKFVVDNTEPLKPIITITPEDWTNGNVTGEIEYSSDSVIKQYRTNGGAWLNYTAPIVITSNENIEAISYDAAGNSSLIEIKTINNIDKVIPTLTVTGNPTSWVNDSAVLTISGNDVGSTSPKYGASGIAKITLDGSTIATTSSTTYTITENGIYRFNVVDNVGNISAPLDVEVTYINKSVKLDTIEINPSHGNMTLNGVVAKVIPRNDFYITTTVIASDKDLSDKINYEFKIIETATNKIKENITGVITRNVSEESGEWLKTTWLINNSNMSNWEDGLYKIEVIINDEKNKDNANPSQATSEIYFVILREKPPVPLITINEKNKTASIQYNEHSILKGELANSMAKEYALGNGNYQDYTGPIDLEHYTSGITIYAKYTDPNKNYSISIKEYTPLGNTTDETETDIVDDESSELLSHVEYNRITKNIYINTRKGNGLKALSKGLFKFLD